MREYKFRGIIKGNEQETLHHHKWFYGDLVREQSTGRTFILDIAHIFTVEAPFDTLGLEVIPETIGQFTGLKDKNGKEIYVGDIVRYISKPREWHYVITNQNDKYYGIFQKCIYRNFSSQEDENEDSEYVFGDFYPNVVTVFIYVDSKRYEIIGNIHDKGEVK